MNAAPGHLPSPRPVRALIAVALALAAAYAASTLMPALRASDGLVTLWDTWVYLAGFALSIAIVGARVALVRTERWAWAALAAAFAASMTGDVLWLVLLGDLDVVPIPSIADPFYLAFYPLAYLALWGIVRARMPRIAAGMWLDGLISGLAVGAVFAALLVDAVVASTGGSVAVVVTGLLYPIGDLLLLLLVGGLVGLFGGRLGSTWVLFGAGLAVWVVSDTLYLQQTAQGTYEVGTPVDAGWPVGMVLVAMAAWRRGERRATPAADWITLLLPAAATLVAALVLVVCALRDQGGPVIAVTLAAAAVVTAVARTFLTFRDVRRLAETRQMALTDELTGLPNRRALMLRLDEAVDGDREVALLLVDLDRFKELNDTLGHHVGDRLLVQAGHRMAATLRPGDLLTRLGGDEFAGVLVGAGADEARAAAIRLRERLEEPFLLDGIPVQIDASVGIALHPVHAASPATLLQYADVAMYEAKAARTGVEIYAAERNLHSRGRLALIGQLRDGIGRGELQMHLQPQVDAASGVLVGVEALVRWDHPERGLLAPGAFLPTVEQTNVMRPLTEHMLREALTLSVAWRGSGRAVPIGVNVAAPNLLDLGFGRTVARLLVETGAEAGDLRLEITEDGVMADPERASAMLEEMRDLGVCVSLDDFGTGQSSLSRLRSLPVDELKIDRSFVLNMEDDDQDAAIVETAATLGTRLGLRVVAEGVESQAAWNAVRDAGCTVIQGYFVSRPLPVGDFEAWRAGWDARVPASLGSA